MSKPILISAALAMILFSCKKDANSKSSNNVKPILGNYKLFKTIDTSYFNANINDGLSSVIVDVLTGDTAYLNAPGSPDYRIEPNPQPNFDPTYVFDCYLNFTSIDGGTETDNGNSFPFTYNSAGIFNDSSPDPTIKSYVNQPTPSTLRVYSIETSNGVISDTRTLLYQKQN